MNAYLRRHYNSCLFTAVIGMPSPFSSPIRDSSWKPLGLRCIESIRYNPDFDWCLRHHSCMAQGPKLSEFSLHSYRQPTINFWIYTTYRHVDKKVFYFWGLGYATRWNSIPLECRC
ncbi:hypothetical protein AG1IA_05419 [Rhizoctonia solani AG-1 IA]|uniref:Uncharacterized protein n=1 Tax=Thanatephorus cucumeris (strain AG1-IA) TaxID=983506 RepID=L8WUT1_THACA|nr:hypothetical protein AG1IA_05419 [Rhizoctonia solani AG-1 IA]